jgi:hypothetical protein
MILYEYCAPEKRMYFEQKTTEKASYLYNQSIEHNQPPYLPQISSLQIPD